ncbi:MAG: hydrogenase maturation protease [Thermodesulfobacteria bacterium]|nr:hydrogenase maturation protease [Thermodesulfobacteriota bacterium]
METLKRIETPKNIGIVGLGNLLLGDEGFGVHLIRSLERQFVFPPQVELIDGGCLGLKLLDLLREKEGLLLIDVFLADAPPGTWRTFSWEELKDFGPAQFASAHQTGVREALFLAELEGLKPKFFRAYGIVPERLAPGTELSPVLASQMGPLIASLVEDLTSLRFEIRRRG